MASQESLKSLSTMQREVECSVCLNVWSNPRTLPCTHIFCKSCLEPLIKAERFLECPECRKSHRLPSNSLDSWSTTRVLINLANSMRDIDISPTFQQQFASTASADPDNSYVEVIESSMMPVDKVYYIIVKLRDIAGREVDPRSAVNSIKAFVNIKPRPPGFNTISIQPKIMRGECYVMYQPVRCGVHHFSVMLDDNRIQGIPIKVKVTPRGIPGSEIKGPIQGPRDVVSCGDNFLVSDGIAKAVFLVDYAGRELKKLKVPRNMSKDFSPMAIATFQGKVFVTDMGNSCIHAYDDLDGFPSQFGEPLLQKPTGAAISADNGNIFVVDNERKTVVIFDPKYSFVKTIGNVVGKGSDIFDNPQMVAINRNGDKLFVADQDDEGNNFIKIVNVFDNKIENRIGVRYKRKQAKPYGITVDDDDNIYVAVVIPRDVQKGYHKGSGDQRKVPPTVTGLVLVYNSLGDYLGLIGDEPYQLIRPAGVVVVASPNSPSVVYVADSPGRQRNGSLKGFII